MTVDTQRSSRSSWRALIHARRKQAICAVVQSAEREVSSARAVSRKRKHQGDVMKILKPLHLVLILGIALSSTLAFAQGPPPDKRGHGPKSHLQKCLSIVQLTDAQKTHIRSIVEAARPKLDVLHQTMLTDRQALRAAIEATPQDTCAIGTAFVKVQADKAAIRAEHEAVRTSVLALLTPEQQAKLQGCLEAPRGDGPPND